MTLSHYQPAVANGPFYARDPEPGDWRFHRGFVWVAVIGEERRIWMCFDNDQDAAVWVLMSEVTERGSTVRPERRERGA